MSKNSESHSWRRIPWRTFFSPISRGIALFLGLFTLLNVVGEFRARGFDANLWWINLPGKWKLLDQVLLFWSAGNTMFHRLAIALTSLICVILFPLAQMACFGMTDYRRHADGIVVFGAKVYEDGDLSAILEERVRTGCTLYQLGLAPQILFSGGPGTGQVHEVEAMRRCALELGVPDTAILLDRDGLDTESTAINTVRIGLMRDWNRIMAVSQFYHLPRIKLAFHRQGSEVYTVPAKRLYTFRSMPYFMARETAAWWFYYIRPLF